MSLTDFLLPWEAQPQEIVRPSDWARERQIALLSFGDFRYDAALDRNTPPTVTNGGRTPVFGRDGQGVTTSGATSTNQTRQVFTNGDWTALIVAAPPSGAGGYWIQQGGGTFYIGPSFDRSLVGTADNSLSVMMLEPGTNRSGARAVGVIDGQPHSFLIRKQGAATPRMWVDGTERTVTNPNGDSFAANPFATSDVIKLLGNDGNGGESPTNTPFFAMAVFNSALTPGECSEITQPNGVYRLAFEPQRVWMPFAAPDIAFVSKSLSAYQTLSADYTFTHTVPAGENRYLVVDVAALGVDTPVTAVTWDSGGTNAPLTKIVSRATGTGAGNVELWGLAAPLTGTRTVRVQLSVASATGAGARSFTNVHQTSSTEATNSNIGTNATPTDGTVNITPVASGTWALAALGTNDTSVASAQERQNLSGVGGSLEVIDTNGTIPAGVAQTMRVTDLGMSAVWTIAGFALRPAPLAPSGIPVLSLPAVANITTTTVTPRVTATF